MKIIVTAAQMYQLNWCMGRLGNAQAYSEDYLLERCNDSTALTSRMTNRLNNIGIKKMAAMIYFPESVTVEGTICNKCSDCTGEEVNEKFEIVDCRACDGKGYINQ